MKLLRKITVGLLCASMTVASTVPVFAANTGYWNFAATPGYNEIPKNITLDYCSNGYNAKITNKYGSSPLNTVVIKSKQYSNGGDTWATIVEISEQGHNVSISKPKQNVGTVTFKVNLRWQSGYTAYNNGKISRK